MVCFLSVLIFITVWNWNSQRMVWFDHFVVASQPVALLQAIFLFTLFSWLLRLCFWKAQFALSKANSVLHGLRITLRQHIDIEKPVNSGKGGYPVSFYFLILSFDVTEILKGNINYSVKTCWLLFLIASILQIIIFRCPFLLWHSYPATRPNIHRQQVKLGRIFRQ